MSNFLKNLLGRILPQPKISEWVQLLLNAIHEHPDLFTYTPRFSVTMPMKPGLEVDAIIFHFRLDKHGNMPELPWHVEPAVRELSRVHTEVVMLPEDLKVRTIYNDDIKINRAEKQALTVALTWWIGQQSASQEKVPA